MISEIFTVPMAYTVCFTIDCLWAFIAQTQPSILWNAGFLSMLILAPLPFRETASNYCKWTGHIYQSLQHTWELRTQHKLYTIMLASNIACSLRRALGTYIPRVHVSENTSRVWYKLSRALNIWSCDCILYDALRYIMSHRRCWVIV